GTTTPQSRLSVAGDLKIATSSGYLNFGADYTTSTSSYGFRDYGGTMQYKNLSGQWVNIGSAGSSGALGSLSDVSIGSAAYGDVLMYTGTTWADTATGSLGLIADNDFTANGLMVRTAAGTYTSRNATGTLNEIYVVNPDGAAGDITFSLPDVVYLGASGQIGRDADNLLNFSTDNQITFRTNGINNMILNSSGYLGIGTTTPQSRLSVAGDLKIATSSGYLNFGADYTTSTSSYGFRDYGGTLQYKNSGGQWVNIGSAGSSGSLGSLSDVSISGEAAGQMLYYTGSTWANSGLITLDASNNFVGFGTTSPGYLVDISTSSTDYLARIYNTSTAASSSGLSIRVDGTGNLLNLNHNGSDVVTISGAATVFSNPVQFGSAGDVSIAYDLIMANDMAGNIIFDGPGYIKTDSSWENLDLTLSAANTGDIVLDDTTVITGTTTIQVTTSANNLKVFTIATSTSGTIFSVDADGDYFYDGSGSSPSADYAEYFYTIDTDLVSGEAVCVDVTNNNAVKRCDRAADGNLMGIVSTRPAIVGNSRPETQNNDNYKIIAMLGQIPAKVSAENGEIRPGDSLTSASGTPGYIMRAEAGDPTVGVALESFNGGRGTINVLISRRNKSLTVEMVEDKITDRIAAMEIEDEVMIMLETALDNYNFASATLVIVSDEIDRFDESLDSRLTVEFDAVSGNLTAIAAGIDALTNRIILAENNLADLDTRISLLEAGINNNSEDSDNLAQVMEITASGNVRLGPGIQGGQGLATTSEPDVAIVEIVTSTSSAKTAFVVNQVGEGDVADFRANGVSIVNIADTGRVSIVGEMLVDGRIMICSGGACGSTLDTAVDETMGDMGVEGKVVAGAFEGYCDDGYAWVPGSAKYGTMPGFCLEINEHPSGLPATSEEEDGAANPAWVNVSQGEAALACEAIADGYHLITENEWLTITENVIRNIDNDCDKEAEGLQLAFKHEINEDVANETNYGAACEATTSSFILSNGNEIFGLAGGAAEWTDQTIPSAALMKPESLSWQEYYAIDDFRGNNITPPYYYNHGDNGIGRIMTGTATSTDSYIRGFVRGASALFDLDMSFAPTAATSTIGFRCAK
ncbi:MAG: hypothetical protein V1867_00005, partial [Candidatus Falkowbacteria bacterium]